MTLDGVLLLTIGAGIGSLATACAIVRRRVLDELSGRVLQRFTVHPPSHFDHLHISFDRDDES